MHDFHQNSEKPTENGKSAKTRSLFDDEDEEYEASSSWGGNGFTYRQHNE